MPTWVGVGDGLGVAEELTGAGGTLEVGVGVGVDVVGVGFGVVEVGVGFGVLDVGVGVGVGVGLALVRVGKDESTLAVVLLSCRFSEMATTRTAASTTTTAAESNIHPRLAIPDSDPSLEPGA